MNSTKQKIYDTRNQMRELVDQMKAFDPADSLSPEYKALESSFDSCEAQIAALEKQLAREGAFEPAPKSDEPAAKAFFGGADGAEKVYTRDGVLKGLKLSSIHAFAAGVRKAMNEGTGAKGGYTVPEDVVTRIYTLIEDEASFYDYVTNETVTTDAGKRTYKTREQHAGFSAVGEGQKIGKAAGPTFAQVSYAIVKRAAILAATNELLADSDENMTAVILKWFADEYRATVNRNVVAAATKETYDTIDSLDDIIRILTVGLGSSIRAISTIHTNASGLLFLQTLKDSVGRYLVLQNPTDPFKMYLTVGGLSVPIRDWPNSVLPNTEDGKIPFFIGSLSEGIFHFDRQQLSVAQSQDATITVTDAEGEETMLSAFEQDMTLFRGIMRDDYKVRDADAWVYALHDPDAPAEPTLTDIVIATPPTKVAYTVGEALDLTGMEVLALYDDGTFADVTEDCAFAPDNGATLALTDTAVTVYYEEGTETAETEQPITVTAAAG